MKTLPATDHRHLQFSRGLLYILAASFPNQLLRASLAVRKLYPNDSFALGMQGRALNIRDEPGTIREAEPLLKKGLAKARNDADLVKLCAYELACVECKLGKLSDAAAHLTLAIEAGGDQMRDMAINDADLQPLRDDAKWNEILGTVAKPQSFLQKPKGIEIGFAPTEAQTIDS